MGTPFTSADQLIGKTPLLELTRLEQKHGWPPVYLPRWRPSSPPAP